MQKRKVHYRVNRVPEGDMMVYYVTTNGRAVRIKRTPDGWFSQGIYHNTLRDAIIYAAYGV